MAHSAYRVLCLALALCACILPVVIQAESVIPLTGADFASRLKDESVALVEFFAPWCGYCKQLAPKLEEAAQDLSKDNLKIFSVNCDDHSELCSNFSVRGYPTMKIFEKGEVLVECNEREAPDIANLLRALSLPAVADLESSTLASFLGQGVALVGLFKEKTSELYYIFDRLANTHRTKLRFGRMLGGADLFKHFDIDAPAAGEGIVAVQDGEKFVYQGGADADALHRFLVVQRLPLLGVIDHSNYEKFIDAKLPMAYIFFKEDKEREALRPQLLDLAKQYRNNVSLLFIDGVRHDAHAASMGLTEKTFPAFTIHDVEGNKKFPMSQKEPVTPATIEAHLKKFMKGETKPHYNSEPLPEGQEGPIFKVVHDNFRQVVMDPTKDVLIEFYATWCRYCVNFAKTYERIAKSYEGQKDKILISQMIADQNDIPEGVDIKVEALPSLFLVTANDNRIIKYDGEFSFEQVTKFITENASNKVQVAEPAVEHDEL